MPLATLAEHSWFYIIWKRVCPYAFVFFDLICYLVTLLQTATTATSKGYSRHEELTPQRAKKRHPDKAYQSHAIGNIRCEQSLLYISTNSTIIGPTSNRSATDPRET